MPQFLLHRQAVLDDKFEYEGSTYSVYLQEAGKIRHVVLVGGLMGNNVYVSQGATENYPIGYASLDQLDIRRQVSRTSVWVYLGLEIVQDSNLKPFS